MIRDLKKFISTTENWQVKLGKQPYCIRAPKYKKEALHDTDTGYKEELSSLRIFDYTQGATDFNIPMCRACRGLIMDDETGEVVSAQFKKSFNYFDDRYFKGLGYMTGDTYVLEEKYDGSLIRLYWYKGQWRVATNSSIDASRVNLKFVNYSSNIRNFEDAFYDILGDQKDKFLSQLYPEYTYIFELIHPQQPITLNYGSRKELIFHGMTRNNDKFIEVDPNIVLVPAIDSFDNISRPKIHGYFYHPKEIDFDQLAMMAEDSDDLKEGYILKRVNYMGIVIQRVKIKIQEYLEKSKLALYDYDKMVFEKFVDGSLDEFISNSELHPYQRKLYDISKRKIEIILEEFDCLVAETQTFLAKEYKERYIPVVDNELRKNVSLNLVNTLNHPMASWVIFNYLDHLARNALSIDFDKGKAKYEQWKLDIIRNKQSNYLLKTWKKFESDKYNLYLSEDVNKLLKDEVYVYELD